MMLQLQRRLAGIALMLWFVATLASAAQAGVAIEDVQGVDPAVRVVQIKGAMERGDAQRVQAHLASLGAGRQIVVRLDSTGGAIDEAMRIGRYLHANRIRVEVAGKDISCLSACALTFLGGRDATGIAWRVKGATAEIGFHGLKRLVPDKEFTVADMQEAVATTQHSLLAIADYLTAIGADIEFMSMMLDKSNSEMNYLSNEKALKFGVHVLQERTGQLTRAQD